MSEPIEVRRIEVRRIDDHRVDQVLWLVGDEYVLTSKVCTAWLHETYAFPADKDGNVTDWMELPGSCRGEVSHEDVIAGYVRAVGGAA